MAAANILSHAAVNRTGDDVLASGRVVPFHGFVELLQEHINFISTLIDLHCPIPTEMLLVIFPFLVGFVRVMWPIVRSAMYNYRARRKKLVVRDIVSVTAPVYRTNGLPTDRNAFLQNAIFMYLSKVVWEKKPIPASEWRNKSSVLLLLDPFRSRIYERSDSPFQIDDSSSDDDGDLAFSNVARSNKKLQRLLLVKLPVGGAWVDTQDELRIEMGYKRQRINIASVVGVERTLSLRARGPDAAQRIETFTQRCLAHFIARIPDMSRNTRNYYELQPSKSGGLLGGGGGGSDGESKMLFKRYPLTDEKNLDTMFFPEKEQVMKFVDDFLFHRGRFAVEGFPYKLGFLLHGPPGSGKTAFVKALAAYTGRHIMSVPLHAVETNQQLYDVFLNRAFTCVGDSETQTMQLDDVIFLLDDVDASSPLVCSRQRRRAIKRRKPAVLTAKEASPEETQRRRQRAEQRQKRREQQNKGDGKDGSRGEDDEEFDDDRDETEEDLEDHIVELQERKYDLPGGPTDDASSAAAMNSLLSAMGVVPGAASKDGTTSVSPRDKSVSQGASTQNLMSLGMGNDMATGGSGSASATAGGGAGGKLTAFDNSGAAGGFARDGKKSLFSLFESADKLDLSGLLNVLDGVVDTPGRIVVMITNHPERLDPALVRPGRMSTRLRLDYIQFDALARMAGLHFGLQEPTPESQDVVRIAEKLEAQITEDHHAMQAARRYRALQTKADSELAAELADDDDVDAGTMRTSTSGEAGKTAISSSTMSDVVDVVKQSETGMTLLEKPVAIPSGVAAARVARRTLSESQVKVLRARIAALEAEAEAWKREHGDDAASATAGSGEKGKMNSANGGESPQIRQSPAPDSTSAGSKGVTDAPTNCPYNFHITPSEVEMMCSQTETLEEFMDMLSQVIRGELRL